MERFEHCRRWSLLTESLPGRPRWAASLSLSRSPSRKGRCANICATSFSFCCSDFPLPSPLRVWADTPLRAARWRLWIGWRNRPDLITAERLKERLPVDNPDDELGRLATVFNETLMRLESSFDQMRRFTADASHELRTPLTAMRSVGEIGLRGKRDPAAYREIIGSMLEEVDRLSLACRSSADDVARG